MRLHLSILSLISCGLFFAACGGTDSNHDAAIQQSGIITAFPDSNDSSLIDFKSLPAGTYALTGLEGKIVSTDGIHVGIRHTFDVNSKANTCVSDDQRVWESGGISLETPVILKSNAGNITPLEDRQIAFSVSRTAAASSCTLSVTWGHGYSTALGNITDVFLSGMAKRTGAIFSVQSTDGKSEWKGAVKNLTNNQYAIIILLRQDNSSYLGKFTYSLDRGASPVDPETLKVMKDYVQPQASAPAKAADAKTEVKTDAKIFHGDSPQEKFPETLELTGEFEGKPTLTQYPDAQSNKFVSLFTGNILKIKNNAATTLPDQLVLLNASSVEFISPVMNQCHLSQTVFGMHLDNESGLFQLQASDDLNGQKPCSLYFAEMDSDGFQVKFTDVPVLNHTQKIKTVLLKVKPAK